MKPLGTRDYEAEVLALMKAMQSAGKAIVLHEAKKALADYPARQATIFEFSRAKHKSAALQNLDINPVDQAGRITNAGSREFRPAAQPCRCPGEVDQGGA